MRSKLTTEVGRRILHAVGTFGAYLVDDAAGNGLGDVNINYEVGVAAEVLELYGVQMLPSTRPDRTPPLPGERALYSDLVAIFQVRSFLLLPRALFCHYFLWNIFFFGTVFAVPDRAANTGAARGCEQRTWIGRWRRGAHRPASA